MHTNNANDTNLLTRADAMLNLLREQNLAPTLRTEAARRANAARIATFRAAYQGAQ